MTHHMMLGMDANRAKGCLYCGLQLPDATDFCPRCGRPIEDTIRVDSGVQMRRTNTAKGCLYCGLQLPDTTDFCPRCGRPIERGFAIRPIQEPELDHLRFGRSGQARQQKFRVLAGECFHFGRDDPLELDLRFQDA